MPALADVPPDGAPAGRGMARYGKVSVFQLCLSMTTYLSTFLHNPPRRPLYLVAAIAMYLTIITVGNIPGARADIGAYAPGAVLHSIAYAVLAALWFTGSRGGPLARAGKAVLAVAVMGAGDEFVQSFFPYRGASVHDWAVDVGAAIVAGILLSLLAARTAIQVSR
jgi:VanZ family protein